MMDGTTIDVSCRHRGEIIETVDSDLRDGRKANIYQCALYDRCTVYTEIAEIHARCFSCDKRIANPSSDPAPKRPTADDLACVHRGDMVDLVGCNTCNGNVRVKAFWCAVHQRCTLQKEIPGIAMCFGCDDKQKPRKPVSEWQAGLTVSVVVISHNYGRYLKDALDSVFSQTHPPDQVILIDDASDDNTPHFKEDQGIEYHRVEHRNVHASRREGFERATSDVIIFLDADDILQNFYIESGLMEFADHTVGIVYSDMQFFGTANQLVETPEFDRDLLMRRNYIHSASMVSREALLLSDAFADDIDTSKVQDDWYLWSKIVRAGWAAKRQTAVLKYRRHDDQRSQTRLKGNYLFYNRFNLPAETITLCIPLSGRSGQWPRLASFLGRQTWPHGQLRILICDTSHAAEFSASVQQWLAASDYDDVAYFRLEVGTAGLADADRCQPEIKKQVQRAMARIYNAFARRVVTDYVWVIEDDIIPPDDVADRLMRSMDTNVASVAAPYKSRFLPGFVVESSGRNMQGGSGVQDIDGNGFGCVILRREVFETTYTSESSLQDFDRSFYQRLAPEWVRRVDWSCQCEHLEADVTAPC